MVTAASSISIEEILMINIPVLGLGNTLIEVAIELVMFTPLGASNFITATQPMFFAVSV